MNTTKKILTTIIIFLFFYGLYFWGIPALINIDKRIDFVETQIFEKTGYKVDIQKPYVKMGHTPAIWFMAEDVALLNYDNSKAVQISHCAVKLHLLPLIFGKVQIGNLSADNIKANLTYTKDSKLTLGQYPIIDFPNSKYELNKAYFRIGNYKISLKDLKQNKNLLLDGSFLNLDEFQKNKRLKMSTFAKFFVDDKSSEIMADIDVKLPINKITENQFKIDGHIKDLDLADFSPYARAIPNSKIQSLSGIINLTANTSVKNDKHKNVFANLTVDNLAIMQEDFARSISCKNRISIKTDIDTAKNGLNIRKLNILSKGIDINVDGDVTKLDAKFPVLNTHVVIKNSRLENFIPLLPGEENLSPSVNFYALKKYPFYSDIEGDLFIKGRADLPFIDGQVLLKNGYLVNVIPNADKATIALDFKKYIMHMDVTVPASKTEAVYVRGDVQLDNDLYSDLKITSTKNVDLKTTQNVLNPLHQILKFYIGPVPIMDIRGIGNIDLDTKGTQEKPICNGIFNFTNTTASFIDINNMVLTNATGSLEFLDDTKTHFKTAKAFLNGKPVSVEGDCDLLGNLDFKVIADNQDLGNLLKIVKSSPMLIDIQKMFESVKQVSGSSDFMINLTGTVKDISDIVFNKNVFAKGELKLNSVSAVIENAHLDKISGNINFENFDSVLDLTSNLGNSNLKITGKLKDNLADVKVISDRFVLKDGFKILNQKAPADIDKIHTSFVALYNGMLDKFQTDKLQVNGKIYASKGSVFSIDNASFDINNGNLKTSQIKGSYYSSPYNVRLNISNILTAKQSVNGDFDVKNFNLSYLDKYFKDFKHLSGVVNLKGQIKNNGVYTETNLNDISFVYVPEMLKVSLMKGKAQIKNDTLYLSKINSYISDMPLSLDGNISNIFKSPVFNLYLTAKPNQEIVEHIFNNKSVYPVKLKGDISFTSVLSGTFNALRAKSKIHLAQNASIYYMGATLGNNGLEESATPFEINMDSIIYPKNFKINSFNVEKLIPSSRGKYLRQLQLALAGEIAFLGNNDLQFHNLKIKTQKPNDARVFNIIFRKPFMKQGFFTSDIVINGKASSPLILGKVNITDIDMPLFDARINDVDVNFKKDKIYLNSKGTVLSNGLVISAVAKNSPKAPYVFDNIQINIDKLNLNKIAQALEDFDVRSPKLKASDTVGFDLSQIIIKKSEIFANNIRIKNLDATNFTAHTILNEKMLLEVKDYSFDVAQGSVKGGIKYNLLNNLVNLTMSVKNTNAQILAENLFDIKGQIYGSVDSDFRLYCNGKNHDTCMQTFGGDVNFNVKNGKMPKLGSLEYLLKAGNLLRSGITGLTINGIVDLITPYKTGDFDNISGNIHILNGIADDIQIYSAGKDLNIYIKGTYNFNNMIADMQVFGALTKNFTTVVNKIANASLNTLFNVIPGINVSQAPSVITEDIKKIPNILEKERMFNAEIYGDINGNDYVRSFKWLK